MRKKILITTTILISIVSSVNAQQSSKVVDVPAPPQTTALFKAVAAPVSYYTGQPDVTIPIYTILQDGVTIPISISFNTSGIFVNEEATAIGLGIRLNWGGSIIRSANGRPDERGLFLEQYKINELTEDLPKNYNLYGPAPAVLTYPYWTYPNSLDLYKKRGEIYHNVNTFNNPYKEGSGILVTDLRPDDFHYNILGNSGLFKFNQSSAKFITFPLDDIKIEKSISGGILQRFAITTNDGVKVILGDDAKEYTKELFTPFDQSWFVKKIVTTKSSEINFEYLPNTYEKQHDYTREYRVPYPSGGYSEEGGGGSYFVTEQLLQTVRFKQGYLMFVYVRDRSDLNLTSSNYPNAGLPAPRLSEIVLYNENNVKLKSFKFHQSYFTSGSSDKDGNRLKLDSISINDSGSNVVERYRFEYYTAAQIPNKKSLGRDHWGYYNGADYNQSLIPSSLIPLESNGFKPLSYSSYNTREINSSTNKIFTIKKIKFPSGGEREFVFEDNKVSWHELFSKMKDISNDGFNVFAQETTIRGQTLVDCFPAPNQVNNNGTQKTVYSNEFNVKDFNDLMTGEPGLFIETTFINPKVTVSQLNLWAYRIDFGLQKKEGEGFSDFYNLASSDRNSYSGNVLRAKLPYLSDGTYRLYVRMTTPPAYIMNTWYDQYGNTVSYGHNTTVKLSYRTKNFSDIRVGGLRIREIIDRDKKNEYKTLYEYTADGNYPSGHTLNIPEYKEYIIGTQAGGTKPYYGYRISSNPVFSVTKTQGNVVGYSNVSKYIISEGTKIKEEFGYSFKKSNRDGYLKEYYSEMEPRTWQSGKLLYSKKYKNDQLLEEEIFDYHGMDNETDKGYTEEINTSLIARGYDRIGFDDSKYSIEPDRRFDNPIVMNNVNLLTPLYGFDNFSAVYAERVGTNLNYNAWVSPMAKIPYFKSYTGFDKIRSKTTRNYDGGIPIIQQENYFYESVPTSLALSKTETITSNDEVLTTKFLYPSDLISEPFMSQLVLDNRISTPIITQKFKNNNKTYEEKTIYTKDESSGNILLPKYFYQANFPNNNVAIPLIGNLEKTLSYDKYNAFGNILQYHFESGMYVTFLYSYNNQYPIAEIKNADFETVCSVLGGRAAVDDFSASNPTDQQIRAWTKLLRDSELLRNSQVMTYTYKPLVGMTSMTDAKGMTTYYEYDGFQRLRLVRDHRQNIVKTYCYGYAGQPISCEEAAKTYRSASRSQAFTRNNCPSGQAGSTVTYTVPEGAYSATSQASADALAAADIAANGQNYANAQGQCLATFSLGYSVPSGRSFLLELRNVSTGQYYSYSISNNGSYAITGLPQGTYSVSVNESNYQGRYMFYLGGKSMAGTRVGFPEMAFTSYQYLYVTPY